MQNKRQIVRGHCQYPTERTTRYKAASVESSVFKLLPLFILVAAIAIVDVVVVVVVVVDFTVKLNHQLEAKVYPQVV